MSSGINTDDSEKSLKLITWSHNLQAPQIAPQVAHCSTRSLDS